MTILILILFATGAAFIQRTTGFGFGIFIMTVLPYIMPSYGEATALSGVLASVTSLILVVRYHSFIPWRRLLPILITFIVVSFYAVQLLSILRSDTLRYVLGVTLILAATYFWFFSDRIKVRPNILTQGALGTLSGIMGGLFGMQGPPAVLYFLQVTKNKEQYTAIAQTYFLIGNIMMTVYRVQAGFFSHEVITCWCWGVPAVLAGTALGNIAFRHISMPLLRKIVYIYIAISGVIAML